MAEERPMPQITVRDPSRPERPLDVLVAGGDERPPLDPAVRRRRLRSAGAVLLLGAVALGTVELRERRAEAAEERRLGSVVELRAEHEGGSSSVDPASGTGRMTLQVLLHNDGPRDLQVLGATLGGYELLADALSLRAGSSRPIVLDRTVTCDGRTPPVTPPGGLRLVVRTVTSERQVEIALPYDGDEALRLCGFRPLDSMIVSFGAIGRPAPDILDLTMDLETRAVAPVRLAAVTPPRGVAIQVRVQGRPTGLPVELASTEGPARSLSVTLRFTVHDCTAALAPSGPDVPAPGPGSSLLVQVSDSEGSVADMLVGYPDGLLDSLVSESC